MQTDPIIFFDFSPWFFSFLNTSSEKGSVFGEEAENSNMQILKDLLQLITAVLKQWFF